MEQNKLSPVTLVYGPEYEIDLPDIVLDNFPFDVNKYRKIYRQLDKEGLLGEIALVQPAPLTPEQLALVHTPEYIEHMADPDQLAHTLELEMMLTAPEMIRAMVFRFFVTAAGGTLAAARAALRSRGIGINLGGGFHHAFPDHGSGFCMIADVPIAIRSLLLEGAIQRPLVVDCDLHQGDGNAFILAGDRRIFTFSIHQEDNFPEQKMPSSLDVGLLSEPPVDDQHYLEILSDHLPRLIAEHAPDIVFYLAGTDVFREDELGAFQLTSRGIHQRDLFVLATAREHKLPLVMLLAGGYSTKSWELHLDSIRSIIEEFANP